MKKIDFIIGSLIRGGAEHVISILANHYCEMGFEVNVVLLLHGAIEYDLNPKINIVRLYGNTKSRFLRIPYWIKSLKSYFKTRQPNYVVSFVCRINLLTLHSLKHCKDLPFKPRIVISERNDPKHDGRGIFAKILTKRYYKCADSIIVQSEEIRKQLPKKVLSKSTIILNPVETKADFVLPNQRQNIIICNGRLTKQKNHILLIKAFEQIINKNNSFGYQLHIYGNGELKNKLLKYVVKHNLSKKVFIFENIPDIQKMVAKSKIFILPSKYEGLSNSLMEAIALGLPTISTPVSGSSSLIDNETGILMKTFSINELTSAIESLLSKTNDEYSKMSYDAIKKSDTYSLMSILHLYDCFIIGDNCRK